MAKVKCLLSLRGQWMGELRMMPAPLPMTRGMGPLPVMLAEKLASMWAKQ